MKLPNPFAALVGSIQDHLHGPNIKDGIANDLKKEELVVWQCDRTIKEQQFLRHMAKAKQAAMIAWINQENMA